VAELAAHLGFSPRRHDTRLSEPYRVVKDGRVEDRFRVAVDSKNPGSARRGYGQGSLVELAPGVWRMGVHLGKDAMTGETVRLGRSADGFCCRTSSSAGSRSGLHDACRLDRGRDPIA
jgi:hypothetical protein